MQVLQILDRYVEELNRILGRFTKTSDGLHIASKDGYRMREISTELVDFINDHIPDSAHHASMVADYYNQGINNWSGSSSYASVERIRGVVTSTITRINRNPKMFSDVSNNKLSSTVKEKKRSDLKTMSPSISSIWKEIEEVHSVSKKLFGRRISFISDSYKRKTIFRDVAHAYELEKNGFSKPAVLLSGGVIEEILRLFLNYKKIKASNKRFESYIDACKDNDLLKIRIHKENRDSDCFLGFNLSANSCLQSDN